MYYWVCQRCDLKVWGAENCWCGLNREQNEELARAKALAREAERIKKKYGRIY
jgi:hypothetical protein